MRAVSLVAGVEAALISLFLAEAAAFSWLGTPDVRPDSVMRTEVVDLCVSRKSARGLSVLRVQHGDRREALQFSTVLHSMRTTEQVVNITFEHRQPVQVVHSPTDKMAAIGCDDGSIYLVMLSDKISKPRLLNRNPQGRICQLSFSPDGRLLLSLDGLSLNVWSVASGALIHSLPTARERFSCFAVVPGSQNVLLASTAGVVYLWSIAEPGRPKMFASCAGHVVHLACSPDGRRAVAVSHDRGDGVLQVWDLNSQQLLWRQTGGHSAAISPAVFSADSEAVISGFAPSGEENGSVTLAVRDAETGETQVKLVGHTDQVTGLATSCHGLVHSASRDGTLRTWDICSGKEIRQVSAHDWLTPTGDHPRCNSAQPGLAPVRATTDVKSPGGRPF